jgi:hypothetical protein
MKHFMKKPEPTNLLQCDQTSKRFGVRRRDTLGTMRHAQIDGMMRSHRDNATVSVSQCHCEKLKIYRTDTFSKFKATSSKIKNKRAKLHA